MSDNQTRTMQQSRGARGPSEDESGATVPRFVSISRQHTLMYLTRRLDQFRSTALALTTCDQLWKEPIWCLRFFWIININRLDTQSRWHPPRTAARFLGQNQAGKSQDARLALDWSRWRYTGRPTPYYKESHRRLRDAVRNWCEEVSWKHAVVSRGVY